MSVYIIHKRRINVGLRRAPEETVGLFKRFFQRKILIAKFLIWKCSWHETDITSTAHVKIPKHSFLHFALGNVSGLFAGGRVFPTLFLQYEARKGETKEKQRVGCSMEQNWVGIFVAS